MALSRTIPLVLLCACSGGTAPVGNPGGGGGGSVPAHILQMEDDALVLINAERTSNGLQPLLDDGILRDVARAHSQDMVDRGFFSHVNPDGQDPFDRITAAGVLFVAAAENIAWNQGFADPAATAVSSWMNSPGHRANILYGPFVLTGMGVAESPSGAYYFTQVFVQPVGPLVLGAWLESGDPGLQTVDQGTSSWTISH